MRRRFNILKTCIYVLLGWLAWYVASALFWPLMQLTLMVNWLHEKTVCFGMWALSRRNGD